MKRKRIIIIGSGLTGLTINYLIKKNELLSKNLSVTILEGRSRMGGRILTLEKTEKNQTLEMGATWFGIKHNRFLNLLDELKLDYFEQLIGYNAHYEPLSTSPPYLVNLPPNPEPSMRLQGGTASVIEKLSIYLQEGELKLSEKVKSIHKNSQGSTTVTTDTTKYEADIVISTLSPYLFYKSIFVEPNLPQALTNTAKLTHTWMGDSIKIALVFKEPFWRKDNGSGTIFSNVGPIPEMYDHCNFEDDFYALKGFFNGSYYSLTKEERLSKVLTQLEKYFGEEVNQYLFYEEAIWRNESLTFVPYEAHITPHQNNGHKVFQSAYLNNSLYLSGTETATQYSGYMEGAVRSAEFIYKQLLEQKL